ncbi:hypothetical protein CSP06_003543 [Salmonella enterica subsp. houtenae]|nr:hypothetical protein [Salmonella enterica subsp. houtenae]
MLFLCLKNRTFSCTFCFTNRTFGFIVSFIDNKRIVVRCKTFRWPAIRQRGLDGKSIRRIL